MSERYDLDRLRAAFAQPDDPPHPDQCPAASDIWEAVHGKLPPVQLREIVEHLASCSACAEAWRVALAMERPEPGETAQEAHDMPSAVSAAHRSVVRRRWPLYSALATAAAAALAVVLGVHDFRRDKLPSTSAIIAQRGASIEPQAATRWLTPSAAALPRSGARLHWSGPQGATYNLAVELIDERGAAKPIPIVEVRGLKTTEYLLPARDLQRLPPQPPGARLHATLGAHLPDGQSEMIFRDFRLQ